MRSKKTIYLLLILILVLTGCKKKLYTVTFDTLGGNVIDSITVTKGDIIKNIETPVKEGYLFVRWLKEGNEYNMDSPVNEDITLTASWIETPEIYNYYKVTFITEQKTEKITVKENDLVPEMEPPIKENYIFLGWYVGEEKFDFNNKITKDITLIGKYKLNVVTITYDLSGGLGPALETIPSNTTVPVPIPPTKEGYKFLKWTLNGKEFSFDTKITEDITLKAEWTPIEYVTIIFDTDGGSQFESKTIEINSQLDSLPTPIKEGYHFIEWQLGNKTFDINTIIDKNITLKAIYEKK